MEKGNSTKPKGRPEKMVDISCPHCYAGYQKKINPDWIKWCRNSEQLSLRSAADEMGISAPYLSDMERGNRDVSLKALRFYEELGY